MMVNPTAVIVGILLVILQANLSYSQVCPELQAPENGTLSLTDGTADGSFATYTCDEGFMVTSGSLMRFCRSSNGQWTGSDVICQSGSCGNMTDPTNGMVTVPVTTLGSSATYSCNSGFALVGDEMRVCQSSLMWSGAEPTCVVDCGSLENLENGMVALSGTREGDTATYSCNEGYELNENGTSERVCGPNGTWSEEEPTCIIVDCGSLSDPTNGAVNLTNTTFGSEASYICDNGYLLSDGGSQLRICQANGNWSSSAPECIIADCGELDDPPNGVVEVNQTTFGSVAEYRCTEGFTIMGNITNRTCRANGAWTEEPICVGIECDILTAPDNGNIIIGPRTVGSLAIYICDDGYTLSIPSPAYRQCQVNGSWSRVKPTCNPVDCGNLTDILNGSVNFTETTFGSISTYSCNDGFGIQGSNERVCEATGQWNGSEPLCESQCSEPCHMYAQCVESGGVNMCVCLTGFEGDGQNCRDIDECALNPCDSFATCTNTVGSFLCTCFEGFEGDGITCTNINECATIGCHDDAICVDTAGSFVCGCNSGFSGDGFTCTDINECDLPNSCNENAECTNTAGSFLCTCMDGYFGDGFNNCTERCSSNFQILLEEILSCEWRFTDTTIRLSQITESVRGEISTQCMDRDTCLPEFYQNLDINNEEFSCSPGGRPLYRASLRGQATQSCAEIELILTEWITGGSASVVVQGNRLSIADYCDIQIDNFTDPIACNEPTTEPPPTTEPIATTVMAAADLSLSSGEMVGIAAGIAAFIVVVVIVASILFVIIVLAIGLKDKKKKSHSHYFEHDLTSPDFAETVINNGNTATQSSPLRPTYSNFNTPDPTVVARMSTFNPAGDVIPTLIRTYSNNSLSRHRVHNVVVENQGAMERTDNEIEYDREDYPQYPGSPSP